MRGFSRKSFCEATAHTMDAKFVLQRSKTAFLGNPSSEPKRPSWAPDLSISRQSREVAGERGDISMATRVDRRRSREFMRKWLVAALQWALLRSLTDRSFNPGFNERRTNCSLQVGQFWVIFKPQCGARESRVHGSVWVIFKPQCGARESGSCHLTDEAEGKPFFGLNRVPRE